MEIADTTAPEVLVVPGAVGDRVDALTLSASATDDVEVTGVRFVVAGDRVLDALLVDGLWVAEVPQSSPAADGDEVYAVAVDAAGNSASSAAHLIRVAERAR